MGAKIAAMTVVLMTRLNFYCWASLSAADVARLNQDLCRNPVLDAAFATKNGNTYFFKGDVFWRIVCDRVDRGYPKSIREVWRVEPPVDAAFTLNNGTSYILKGTKFWRFWNEKAMDGYPRDYRVEWDERLPAQIDAALPLLNSKAVYLINGALLFKYIFEADGGWSEYGPNSTFIRFRQIKSLPRAALRRKRKGYLFTGKYSYRDTRIPPYFSRPTSLEWLQCKNDKPLYIDETCCEYMRWRTPETANVKGALHCPSIVDQYERDNPDEPRAPNLTKRSAEPTGNSLVNLAKRSEKPIPGKLLANLTKRTKKPAENLVKRPTDRNTAKKATKIKGKKK